MGCGHVENTTPGSKSGADETITIWGDYFNQDTRALLAICQISGISSKFELVDTSKKQNLEKNYTDLNPNFSIPMITEGHTKIIGDGPSLYYYLVNKHEAVTKTFYPDE